MSNEKTPEGKIIIEQELPLEVQHFETCTFISQKYPDTNEEECVDVESKNRKKLAIAICPELEQSNRELLEALEKSNKLLNTFRAQNKFGKNGMVRICSQELYDKAFDCSNENNSLIQKHKEA